jgi:hypothetical protein
VGRRVIDFYPWLFLLFMFNLLWFFTYALVLRRGYLDKAAGIPLFSLTLNLAWDISGAFIIPSPLIQHYLDIGFVVLNVVFTLQWFRYWRNDFPNLSAFEFFFFWVIAQTMSFFVILLGNIELNDVLLYKMGFIDNFINSILFIALVYQRSALQGQSIYIGITKLLATGSMSLAMILRPVPGLEDSVITIPLYVGIVILDVIYVAAYYAKARRLGIDPWRRW